MECKPDNPRDSYHVGNLAAQLLGEERRMLEQVGSTKLSMRALCAALGVTPTAAYHHFKNRADLLAELASQGFNELAAVLEQTNSHLPMRDKIRGFCVTYLDFARCNPALYQLMFGPDIAVENMPKHLLEARESAFNTLESMVAELLKQPLNSPEVRSAALASWSYIHGLTALLIHQVLQRPITMTDQQIVERTLAGLELLFKAQATVSTQY